MSKHDEPEMRVYVYLFGHQLAAQLAVYHFQRVEGPVPPEGDSAWTAANSVLSGGVVAGTGAATPGTGGATPGTGGATPGTGSATPGTGGVTSSKRMTLLAEKITAVSGQTINVPVWLFNGQGLVDMNFNIEYDASVALASQGAARGNLLAGADFEANANLASIVKLGFVPAQGGVTAEKGTVAQIPFKAVGPPGSRTPLRVIVKRAMLKGESPANVSTFDGEIIVVDASGTLPGDLNGNGQLDMDDVLRALKMSVDLIPVNMVADIDKDGRVTSTDARLIRERFVGMQVTR